MISKEKLLFLIMALLCFCFHPSASPLVNSQENMKERAAGEDFINEKYDQGSGTAIAHQNKYSHGANAGGGNGGQPTGGDSHSPSAQGGGSATPVYAAGAANNRHYHHGGGNRDENRPGLATLAITTFACSLLSVSNDW